MKKIVLGIFLFTCLLFGATTNNFDFLVKNEQKVKKVYFDQNFKKLVVLVKDDGTNRNGYAQYISLELKEHGYTTKDVAIIYIKDISTPISSIKEGNGKVLGKARMVR